MFSKLYGFVAGDTEIPQVDTHWFSESGIIDVFIMLGPTPGDVFSQYALLTGTTSLPPVRMGILGNTKSGNTCYVQLICNTSSNYCYRFIVRFPIGLDFLFITFRLHFSQSWMSSLSISSSAISHPHSLTMSSLVFQPGFVFKSDLHTFFPPSPNYVISSHVHTISAYHFC